MHLEVGLVLKGGELGQGHLVLAILTRQALVDPLSHVSTS